MGCNIMVFELSVECWTLGLVATGCNQSFCVSVVGGLVANGLSLVFLEICPKGNQLQSQLSPKKEKDWTGPDFQTLFFWFWFWKRWCWCGNCAFHQCLFPWWGYYLPICLAFVIFFMFSALAIAALFLFGIFLWCQRFAFLWGGSVCLGITCMVTWCNKSPVRGNFVIPWVFSLGP